MTLKRFFICGVSVGLLTVALTATGLMTGCEEADGITALVVEPDFADLTATTSTGSNTLNGQTFTVTEASLQGLSLPLKWRVSNPALGNIAQSGGRSASYVRTLAHGDNSILVTDQFGAEGIATVRQ
ncbi:MAG: hypothetical protein O3C57_07275 [Verrucomicrobia bacterium]|nr:hypothetical protein [Verrucomicrobiota bacterium]